MIKLAGSLIFLLFITLGCAIGSSYNLNNLESQRSRQEFIEYREMVRHDFSNDRITKEQAMIKLQAKFSSLQARDQEDHARWWNSLSPQERAAYIQADAMRQQQIIQMLYGNMQQQQQQQQRPPVNCTGYIDPNGHWVSTCR